MHDNRRDSGEYRRSLDDLNETIPCPQRHRIIQSTDGHVVICCTLLDNALGWWHAVTASMCIKCAAHHGIETDDVTKAVKWKAEPKQPTVQGSDPLSIHYKHMMLHPLRTALPDDQLKEILNYTRDETIERAKREGVDAQDILNAIVVGVKASKLDPRSALKIAEKHQLIK